VRNAKINEVFRIGFMHLLDEYGLSILKERKEDWGYILEGKNSTTGIRVVYEFKEAHVKIMLYRLVDGKIVDNTIYALQNDEKISGFSLEHIVALLNPKDAQSIVFPADNMVDEQDDLQNYLFELNTKIRKYAANILLGDFSLFDELDKQVKKEYQNYYTSHKPAV
jgi:hypothetical protein